MKIIRADENVEVAKLIKEVKEDLYCRQLERRNLEEVWIKNLNFIYGKQYENCKAYGGNVNKKYEWEEKKVYNHISGIMDTRQSKLCANRPNITVIPASSDSKDMATARTCQAICQNLWYKNRLADIISKAINWSEICGTSFYKVTWNSNIGQVLKDEDGSLVKSGDIQIDVVSPFEIYPQNLTYENLNDNESIIHARAYTTTKIKDMYDIDVDGENIDVMGLSRDEISLNNAYLYKDVQSVDKYALVIEKYYLPTKKRPNGRLVIICGNYLCYDGDLPYINTIEGTRGYPFIKQESLPQTGSFFGSSVIERCIPLQQDYNALKNRKVEFLNRISMGVVMAEEGSVDIDNLEEEGLEPGKVIVYRQGANPPTFMATTTVPVDFAEEEIRIQNEFSTISGVNDLIRQSKINYSNLSGTALQILLEQENSRLSVSLNSINNAICNIAAQVLRLYKQFATYPRVLKIVGEKGVIDALCFSNLDISTDEVVLDTQSEAIMTKAQKRSMIFEILSTGILQDENGKLQDTTRQKIIEMLGLGVYDMGNDEASLQVKYAQKENLEFSNGVKDVKVQEIDNHDLHIKEHICFLLGAEGEKLKNSEMYEIVLDHIREHKKFKNISQEL